MLSRIVYAAERYEFFKERKWFATAEAALLLHSVVGIDWIHNLSEHFGTTR
jgi:hypothetical protein